MPKTATTKATTAAVKSSDPVTPRGEALYRRWRPQRFSDLVGQDAISAALRSAISNNQVAQALLFSGPRGTGKTSTARILARALNCLAPQEGDPCGSCQSCINSADSLDVLEIDAATNGGVDQIRSLRERVHLAPADGTTKVYILDEVHELSSEAFNALLKTLEEPPPFVVFILATTEPGKVPDTVRSRCQRYGFRRAATETLVAHLGRIASEEGWALESEAAALLASASEGSFRDGLVLLEQAALRGDGTISTAALRGILGVLGETALNPLLDTWLRGEAAGVYTELDTLMSAGAEPQQMVRELLPLVRARLRSAASSAPADAARYARLLEELARADGAELSDLALELALYRSAAAPAAGAASPASSGNSTPSGAGTAAKPAASKPAAAPAPAKLTPKTPHVMVLAPTEPPAAVAAPAAPALPEDDLATIRAQWARVAEALHAQKSSGADLFRTGGIYPVSADGTRLVLEADTRFRFKWLETGSNAQLLGTVLREIYGRTFVVTSRMRQAAAPVEGAAAATPLSAAEDELVRVIERSERFFEAS